MAAGSLLAVTKTFFTATQANNSVIISNDIIWIFWDSVTTTQAEKSSGFMLYHKYHKRLALKKN
jgi:hypothetical protein